MLAGVLNCCQWCAWSERALQCFSHRGAVIGAAPWQSRSAAQPLRNPSQGFDKTMQAVLERNYHEQLLQQLAGHCQQAIQVGGRSAARRCGEPGCSKHAASLTARPTRLSEVLALPAPAPAANCGWLSSHSNTPTPAPCPQDMAGAFPGQASMPAAGLLEFRAAVERVLQISDEQRRRVLLAMKRSKPPKAAASRSASLAASRKAGGGGGGAAPGSRAPPAAAEADSKPQLGAADWWARQGGGRGGASGAAQEDVEAGAASRRQLGSFSGAPGAGAAGAAASAASLDASLADGMGGRHCSMGRGSVGGSRLLGRSLSTPVDPWRLLLPSAGGASPPPGGLLPAMPGLVPPQALQPPLARQPWPRPTSPPPQQLQSRGHSPGPALSRAATLGEGDLGEPLSLLFAEGMSPLLTGGWLQQLGSASFRSGAGGEGGGEGGEGETLALFPATAEGYVSQVGALRCAALHAAAGRVVCERRPGLSGLPARRPAPPAPAAGCATPTAPAARACLAQVRWYSLQFLLDELVEELGELRESLGALAGALPYPLA